MYFLVASGLSLIYGLMGVLNFAHGVLITIGAYSAWWVGDQLSGPAEVSLLAGTAFALLVGAVIAAAIELVFIRPLYRRPIEQILVTVGLALALGALIVGIFGPETKVSVVPSWMIDTTMVLGEPVPNDRFVEIAVAAVVLVGLIAFLRYTRYGLVIRAGVENRSMVTALGVDVQRAFTLVFALGGALAALAGVLSNVYFASVEPGRGTSLLIYAFIVVVIGGFGSIGGAAVAGVAVALLQNYANFYGTTGAGDMAVVALLAITLLVRPHGLAPEGRALRRALRWGLPAALVVLLAVLPYLALGYSCRVLWAARLARNAPAARPLPRLRRRRPDLRPALRLHRSHVIRPRPLLRHRRLCPRYRDDEVGMGGRRSRSRSLPRSPSSSRSSSERSRCGSRASRSRWSRSPSPRLGTSSP